MCEKGQSTKQKAQKNTNCQNGRLAGKDSNGFLFVCFCLSAQFIFCSTERPTRYPSFYPFAYLPMLSTFCIRSFLPSYPLKRSKGGDVFYFRSTSLIPATFQEFSLCPCAFGGSSTAGIEIFTSIAAVLVSMPGLYHLYRSITHEL